MGFGVDLGIKVEVPKVEVPKVDVASAVSQAVGAATSAVAGAAASLTGAVAGAVAAAAGAAAELASVAGAIADVAVSFTGAIEDLVLEPHLQLSANASYESTNFEEGPVWVRIELTPDEARACTDTVHLFSDSGAYDQQQAVSDFVDANERTVRLLFVNAPMGASYSLEIVGQDGGVALIFSGILYGDLFKSKGAYLDPGGDG